MKYSSRDYHLQQVELQGKEGANAEFTLDPRLI